MSPMSTTIGAIIVAFGIAPQEDVARESVDLIELNHFYDEHGRLVFDQVIFYDWSAADARYNVRAWRLVKNPAQLPQRDWTGGGYTALWQDGEQIRHIYSKSIRETWTQYDPELVEREYLPKEKRKELRTVRANRTVAPTVTTTPQPPASQSSSGSTAVVAVGR